MYNLLLKYLLVISVNSLIMANQVNMKDVINRIMTNIHPAQDSVMTANIYSCIDTLPVDECKMSHKSTNVKIFISGIIPNINKKPTTLILFMSPIKIKGQVVMHQNNNIWIQFPRTSSPIRIPPVQNIMGDVDVGSLLDEDYRYGYEYNLLENTKIIIRIEIINKTTKEKILYSIDKNRMLPISAEFLSKTNRKIRFAEFLDFKKIKSKYRLTKVKINSLIKENNTYTIIEYIQEEAFKINSIFLHPRKLKKFTKIYGELK